MCHGEPVSRFPAPEDGSPFNGILHGLTFGPDEAANSIAIIPDIWGCNPFYRGLATYYARRPSWVISLSL